MLEVWGEGVKPKIFCLWTPSRAFAPLRPAPPILTPCNLYSCPALSVEERGSTSPHFLLCDPSFSAWSLALSPRLGSRSPVWVDPGGVSLTDSPSLRWPDNLPWDRGYTTYSAGTVDFEDSNAYTTLLPKKAPSSPGFPQLFTTSNPFGAPPFPSSSLLG